MKKKIAIIVLMLLSIIIPVKAFAKEQYKTLNLEETKMAHDEPWETCNIFVHNHIHIQKFETRCEWLNYKMDTLMILTTFSFELGSKIPLW